MGLFKSDKQLHRLNQMIDNAINGNPIEKSFDETKLSALETKLSRYLATAQTSRTQLEEDKKHIHALVSDISHQTKTPLANILLYTQFLEEQNLSGGSGAYVAALSEQTEKLNFLIGALVKASRLETGIISLNPQIAEVGTLLQTVAEQMRPKAMAKSIALSVQSCQATACFDSKWTIEALCNIVDNAIKYTPIGGAVKLSVTPYQMFCRIDIADTGPGIAESEYAKIFRRFYRSPEVSDTEGIGIGLYLAREIVARQGGYIKVKSVLKQGSTFSVFLSMEN